MNRNKAVFADTCRAKSALDINVPCCYGQQTHLSAWLMSVMSRATEALRAIVQLCSGFPFRCISSKAALLMHDIYARTCVKCTAAAHEQGFMLCTQHGIEKAYMAHFLS